jgi:hypothetical protein
VATTCSEAYHAIMKHVYTVLKYGVDAIRGVAVRVESGQRAQSILPFAGRSTQTTHMRGGQFDLLGVTCGVARRAWSIYIPQATFRGVEYPRTLPRGSPRDPVHSCLNSDFLGAFKKVRLPTGRPRASQTPRPHRVRQYRAPAPRPRHPAAGPGPNWRQKIKGLTQVP